MHYFICVMYLCACMFECVCVCICASVCVCICTYVRVYFNEYILGSWWDKNCLWLVCDQADCSEM